MFLTRFELNLASRKVIGDLGNVHGLHQRVMSLFGDDLGESPRRQARVLFRLETPSTRGPELLVQSAVRPDGAALPPGYLEAGSLDPMGQPRFVTPMGALLDGLHEGGRFLFRLRANVTKKVKATDASGQPRKNSVRVPLRSEEEQIAWLVRQGERWGFRLDGGRDETRLAVRVREEPKRVGLKKGQRRATHASTLFDGVLVVTDRDRMAEGLVQGVGPAKAYGFGLLSVAPAALGAGAEAVP